MEEISYFEKKKQVERVLARLSSRHYRKSEEAQRKEAWFLAFVSDCKRWIEFRGASYGFLFSFLALRRFGIYETLGTRMLVTYLGKEILLYKYIDELHLATQKVAS